MRRVAAILNATAGAVTHTRIALIRAELGDDAVWVTTSLADAERAFDTIVAGGFDVVCTGGGDGTFVHAVAALAARHAHPILFAFALGSGNAIAEVCGASAPSARGIARDLARARGDEPAATMRLLDVESQLAHSVGFGVDATYNVDLDRVAKPGRKRWWTRPLFAGVPGMAITAAVRTMPRLARGYAPHLRIVASGPATRLAHDGSAIEEVPAGTVLRDAPTTIAAASTVATYGRGLILFPYAERHADRVHLRCGNFGALGAIHDLACMFAGSQRWLVGIEDFLVSSITIEAIDRCPAHRGGEVWWPEAPVAIAISAEPIAVLR
jgi:Diacylglycerol kinase catalytic domain